MAYKDLRDFAVYSKKDDLRPIFYVTCVTHKKVTCFKAVEHYGIW